METILVVAAHPDDEILGCGGTMARHANNGDTVHVLIMAEGLTSRDDHRDRDARSEELSELARIAKQANDFLGAATFEVLPFPDNRMDSIPLLDVVKEVEKRIETYRPSVVYTHHIGDVNVDHQIVHKAVVTACRPVPGHCVKTLLFFEIASSTEWQVPDSGGHFSPNWFNDISMPGSDGISFLQKKLAALKIYECEMREFPHSRSLTALEHLAKWRGASIGVNASEAFILGRQIQ